MKITLYKTYMNGRLRNQWNDVASVGIAGASIEVIRVKCECQVMLEISFLD